MGKPYAKVTVACQSTIANLLQNSGGWPKGIQGKSPVKLTAISKKPAVAWHLPRATQQQVTDIKMAFSLLKIKLKQEAAGIPMYATVAVYLDHLENAENEPLLTLHEEEIYTNYSDAYTGTQANIPSRSMKGIYSYTNQLQIGLASVSEFVDECTVFLDRTAWLTLKLMGLPPIDNGYWLEEVPFNCLKFGDDMVMQTTAWQQLRQIVLPALLDLPAGGYKLCFRAPQENIVWSYGELADYPIRFLRTVYHLGQPTQCRLPEVQHTDLGSLLTQVGDCYDPPF